MDTCVRLCNKDLVGIEESNQLLTHKYKWRQIHAFIIEESNQFLIHKYKWRQIYAFRIEKNVKQRNLEY